LGRGGMGRVYRARGADGQDVAIKVLSQPNPDRLARFERERRLIGSFTARDGFVPLLDAGTSSSGPYLVMPLVPGGTLRDRLEHGPLSLDATLALGRALAASIARAHEKGIVHRDLKPENVLFAADDSPLVADIGLAKHFDDTAAGASQSVELSVRGALRGTAGYMAPEQMEDAASAGPPADVFALGAILYECLAGHPAFEGATLVELLSRVSAGKFEPVRRACPAAPPWLAAVIDRALARDPAARQLDAGALLRALAPPRRPGRVSPALVAGAVLLAVAGAVAFVVRPRARPAPRPSSPPPPPSAPTPPPPPSATTDRADIARRIEEHRRAGDASFEAGDYPVAVKEYGAACELDPESVEAWTSLGAARAKKGDSPGALTALDRAVRLDPKHRIARMNRGLLRELRGDLDGAIDDFEIALELAGDAPQAAGELRRSLRKVCVRASFELVTSGVAYAQKGQVERGLADFDRAIVLDPWNAEAWRNRATARYQLGDRRTATVDATKAIELEPAVAIGWSSRAMYRRLVGDLDGAIADATTAIELDPRLAEGWIARADALAEKKDFKAAIADYDRSIEVAPDSPFGWRNRGTAKRGAGDTAGALADYEYFLRRWPEGPQAPAVRNIVGELRAGK
ncbi:MAG: tetratricopeptide repeat protein, partial [Planctomycetota bacterium]